MNIRLLTPADLPALMHLKDAAGWNQTEDDWLRLLRLEPEGCFGAEVDGTLAASTTVVCYGDRIAWIGMVLTDPDFRGRGLARALMHKALEYSGSRRTELDASDMGRPLYLSLGFADECPIERWLRPPGDLALPGGRGSEIVAEPHAQARGIRDANFCELTLEHSLPLQAGSNTALDAAVFGADRSALLNELITYGGVTSAGSYAFSRPGSNAAYFGPAAASNPEELSELVAWAITRYPNQTTAWDLFPHQQQTVSIARQFGFAPVRRLMRMVLSPELPRLPDPRMSAIAGFEYG